MTAGTCSARVLNPVDRVSEIIFGLLMALSFTGSISVATAGREEVRTMMAAALGCNLAWGLTDAVMYLIGTAITRARAAKLLSRLRATANAATAHELIIDTLPWPLDEVADASVLESIRRRLLFGEGPMHRVIGSDDLLGALGVFILVVLATLKPTMTALRISNLVALIMLFASGWVLARHAGLSAWLGGVVMALVGCAMVGAIVALGG